MATKKVFIGVGHGGSDPGAVANGLREEDLNLTTALACHEELVRHGVITLMSRVKDEEDTLKQEIAECNAFDPDLAADLHHNSGGGDGAEVYHSIVGGTGKTLAQNILGEIVKTGQNSRGVKTRKNERGTDWYGFIRQTKCPAVIVEYAFLDHAKDHEAVDTVEEQRAMGVATAKGILKTLGIEYIEPEKEEPVADTSGVTVTLPVLKKGSKGSEVKALQALLKGLGYGLGIWGIDGDFGAQTVRVVQQYQKKKGLGADGVVGATTWKKLLGI